MSKKNKTTDELRKEQDEIENEISRLHDRWRIDRDFKTGDELSNLFFRWGTNHLILKERRAAQFLRKRRLEHHDRAMRGLK